MKPIAQPKPASRTLRNTFIGAIAALLAIAPFATGAGDDAVITVVFDADDMGFNATSSKEISNIRVEDCDGGIHVHDDLEGYVFVHREDFVIAAVYVKSGDNGVRGVGPQTVNTGACDEETSSSSSTTAESSSTTDESSTTTGEESTTTADSSTTDDNSTEVPFFTSGAALVLGVGGALVGTLMMLRRRL